MTAARQVAAVNSPPLLVPLAFYRPVSAGAVPKYNVSFVYCYMVGAPSKLADLSPKTKIPLIHQPAGKQRL